MILANQPRDGEFEGSVTLIAAGQPSTAQNILIVSPTDEIWASYFDASNAVTIETRAALEIISPSITDIEIVSDYGRAAIRWNTSEPADSLVQYGESQILGRAASDLGFSTSHELVMDGLIAGKTYLCRVISRDLAGNSATDDNVGAFYSFKPLTPLTPPWSDDLESGTDGWTVIAQQGLISDTELSIASALNIWEFGTPANVLDQGAHSGRFAWGSNLSAGLSEGADTLLMTPAIELTGGNKATLQFWHNYDFTVEPSFPAYDVTGEAYVTTDNGLTLEELLPFTGRSNGWQPVEIDLTSYVGKTVRVGFYFGFLDVFNLDNVVQPGWLIDDLEVTTIRNEVGTIEITSNLTQTRFEITGASSQTGQGLFNSFNLLPAGDYTITFHEVPFYATPAAISTTLAVGETAQLFAQYALADGNENGLADEWEELVFGETSDGRTANSDSDDDGESDFAEFVSGTNANDKSSKLLISEPLFTDDSRLLFRWNAATGRAYRIESSIDGIIWLPATNWATSPDNSPMVAELPLRADTSVSFYRLHVMP